jgi:hypothetical protein
MPAVVIEIVMRNMSIFNGLRGGMGFSRNTCATTGATNGYSRYPPVAWLHLGDVRNQRTAIDRRSRIDRLVVFPHIEVAII